MTLLRRASAIAAFFLLTSAATAHAECAWVLWSGKTNPWRAHETKKDCEGDRKVQLAIAALDAEKYQTPTKAPDLECLPDTQITETPSVCNWMLWTYVAKPRPPKTVFATKQECEMARDNANQTLAKGGDSFTCGELDISTPPVWLLSRRGRGMMPALINTFKTYQQCQRRRGLMKKEVLELAFCLPDTVDPRGPKAK